MVSTAIGWRKLSKGNSGAVVQVLCFRRYDGATISVSIANRDEFREEKIRLGESKSFHEIKEVRFRTDKLNMYFSRIKKF